MESYYKEFNVTPEEVEREVGQIQKENTIRRLRSSSTKEKLLPRVKRQALWTTPLVIERDSGSMECVGGRCEVGARRKMF